MCECYQIGGRFIAEDPDCPTHGTAATARDDQVQSIMHRIEIETDVEILRELARDLLTVLEY